MIKKLIVVISIVFLLAASVACNSTTTPSSEPMITSDYIQASLEQNDILSDHIVDDGDTQYVSNTLDRIRSYESVEMLNEYSDLVFSGTTVSSESVFQNHMLYTLTRIKISTVVCGNIKTGDIVTIVEDGGRTTFGEYEENCGLTEKAFEQGGERLAADKKIVVGYDGYFPLSADEDVLIFAVDISGFLENYNQPLYTVTGSYDGKFYLLEDDQYGQLSPSKDDRHEFNDRGMKISLSQLVGQLNSK